MLNHHNHILTTLQIALTLPLGLTNT